MRSPVHHKLSNGIVLGWILLSAWIVMGFAFLAAPPPRAAQAPSFRWCLDQKSCYRSRQGATEQDQDGDPDLLGVRIDGFPLPPTPVRSDDQELLADLHRVPVTSLDQPLPARSLEHLDPNQQQPTAAKNNNQQQQQQQQQQPLRVIIAGGGLGGLALASTLIRKGFDVHVFEQATQYKPFGGPIQIQSNALSALQQIHPVLYSAVAEAGVQTGDRLSGIQDGKRYKEGWLVQFDAATPALQHGLPLTLAINRVVLQEIFLKYGVPAERIHTAQRVVRYENVKGEANHDNDGGVAVHLQDGRTVYADLLVGADGIWSRVRHQMYGLPPNETGPDFANKHAQYSGYTCYTGK